MAETTSLDYLIPGLLSLGGAAIGSAGSNAAANKYIGGLDQAASLYKESAGQARQDIQGMYNTARQGLQPYAQAGNKALNQYGSYLYGDPSQAQQRLEQTPGYQWSLSQGSEAVNRAMAGQGYNLSGNRAIALQEYGQGLASQTYQNQLDNLYKLSSQGQNAAGNLANLASSTGANLANVQTGLGTALSGLASERGQVAGAEAAGQYGAFGGVLGDLAQQYGQQTMQEELINMLGGKGASTAAGQAIQSVLNDSGISSYLANTFGTSQATGAGLANSVFGGAAATTGYLGTGVGSGLVGGSALSSGVTGGSLGSTYSGVQGANLLGSLTSQGAASGATVGATSTGAGAGGGAAVAGASIGAGLFGAGVAGLVLASALSPKNREIWPKVVNQAKANPEEAISTYSNFSKSPGAVGGTHKNLGNFTMLVSLANVGAYSMQDIPESVWSNPELEKAFIYAGNWTSDESNYLIGDPTKAMSAGLAGLEPSDVAMLMYANSNNPKVKSAALKIIGRT